VEQRILFVRTEAERDAALHRQLQLVPATARVLVFVSTKKMCETLARSLRREHTCAALHGDKVTWPALRRGFLPRPDDL
jgi:superfamily II DNA/RNA helicase